MLPGIRQSGKSTVLKQMRIVQSQGFSQQEREEARSIVLHNILVAFRLIWDYMSDHGLLYEQPASYVSIYMAMHFVFALIPCQNRQQDLEQIVGSAQPDEHIRDVFRGWDFAMTGLLADRGFREALARWTANGSRNTSRYLGIKSSK